MEDLGKSRFKDEDEEFHLGHVRLRISIRCPRGVVYQTLGYSNVELRGQERAEEVNLELARWFLKPRKLV